MFKLSIRKTSKNKAHSTERTIVNILTSNERRSVELFIHTSKYFADTLLTVSALTETEQERIH